MLGTHGRSPAFGRTRGFLVFGVSSPRQTRRESQPRISSALKCGYRHCRRSTAMFARLPLYLRLVRMDKPIGSLLLLWPTLNALWIASSGHPSPMLLLIFVLGTLLMRSAGCAINDYADRDFDKHVKRTENRPITSGKIAAWEAVALAAALSLIAFLLILPLNTLTKELSVFALFVAGSYPFIKRIWVLRLASAFQWPSPPCRITYRRSRGSCSPRTCSGRSPMTPNTRWS